MKRFLLLTAAATLVLGGVSAAQTQPEAVPASPPPIQAPAQTPDVNVEGDLGNQTQAPPNIATQGPAAAEPAQTEAQSAVNAEAMAASPASPPDATAVASVGAVCDPRVTTVHFGARGSALSRENRNAIEHAVDAASVCSLQHVIIAASGQDRLASRRTEAARQVLVRQGVPNEMIAVSADAAEGEGTGQVNVRMEFAGVAAAQTGAHLSAPATAPAAADVSQPESNEAAPTPES